uniref:Thioredoxin M-type, chloroplastic n=1 Tax=Elaeis guineensis var. tenera TaxID=51953 RepID=A0A6I9RR60_ELAGV|nr:thioredoxin M-type, chloroplastic [Elaeis guineensis]
MALETCFQMSTVASTTTTASRARFLQAHHHFSCKEKHIWPASSGFKRAISSLPSSPNPSMSILPVNNRCTRFICQAKNVVDEVLVANEANWDNMVIGCEAPVLVDFWAPWCGPCRMIAPVIDELAKDYAGKIVCCKVNTDDCPNIASKYGIRSIPTVLLFKNGDKKESVIGAVPKSTLCDIIDKYLEM